MMPGTTTHYEIIYMDDAGNLKPTDIATDNDEPGWALRIRDRVADKLTEIAPPPTPGPQEEHPEQACITVDVDDLRKMLRVVLTHSVPSDDLDEATSALGKIIATLRTEGRVLLQQK